jgi:hypothetical protein
VSGGASGIGAIPNFKSPSGGSIEGDVGAVTGTVSYSEAPTIRYQPLAGQALIRQISRPVSVDAIVNAFNSDLGLGQILSFAVDRITPDWGHYYPAINTLIELDNFGAITLSATKKPKNIKNSADSINNNGPADILTIYFQPTNIDTREATCSNLTVDQAKNIVKYLWKRLKYYYAATGDVAENSIDIPSQGTSAHESGGGRPPILATRSALGIMKNGSPAIAIMTEQEVRLAVKESVNADPHCKATFYWLDPYKFPSAFESSDKESQITNDEREKYHKAVQGIGPAPDPYPTIANLSADQIENEKSLGNVRSFYAYCDIGPCAKRCFRICISKGTMVLYSRQRLHL